MAQGEFHKMHGLGNDFVVIDAREHRLAIPPARARAIADRRFGIGCDQLILLEDSDEADIAMRIFNADGGEVEACGNASRCVIKLLGRNVSIETVGGIIDGRMDGDQISVNMGRPRFKWDEIPLDHPMDTASMPVAWEELENPTAVNVGNPHAVFFVPDAAKIDLQKLGPLIESDVLFPRRVNVNVADISDKGINLRVWERGVGETRACGTGACATAVAAITQKLAESPVQIQLKGGQLTIAWDGTSDILMTGDATHVFTGQTDWEQFG